MILVSFFLEDSVLSDEIKICYFLGYPVYISFLVTLLDYSAITTLENFM